MNIRKSTTSLENTDADVTVAPDEVEKSIGLGEVFGQLSIPLLANDSDGYLEPDCV